MNKANAGLLAAAVLYGAFLWCSMAYDMFQMAPSCVKLADTMALYGSCK